MHLRPASTWPASSGCLSLICRGERSSGLGGIPSKLTIHSFGRLLDSQPSGPPTHLASLLCKERTHSRCLQQLHAVPRIGFLNLGGNDVQATRGGRRRFLQLRRSSPDTPSCGPFLSSQNNTRKLVAALEEAASAAESPENSWICCDLSLSEALAATTALNATTAALCSLGGDACASLQKGKSAKQRLPLLLPLTVSPQTLAAVEAQTFSAKPPSTGAVTEPADAFALLLLVAKSPEAADAAVRMRLLKPLSKAVFLHLIQDQQLLTEGAPASSEEALAWLHFVAAADIAAGVLTAGGMGDGLNPAAAAARKKGLSELLLLVLQLAVHRCTDTGVPTVAAAVVLEAVGALSLLAASRPLKFLSPYKVETSLLQVLTRAESLLLLHQQRLNLTFAGEGAPTTAASHESSCCSEEEKQQQQQKGCCCSEENLSIHNPAQADVVLVDNASFVLGLLGWLQRFGTSASKAASARVVAPLADCLGEHIEALNATETSNLLFAVSWPRFPLAPWQEYLIFMASRRFVKTPMQPLLAARVFCTLADVGLEASALERLEPEISSLPPEILSGLLRACAKVRHRQVAFLLPALRSLECSAAQLRPAVAAQALEAAGDLDLKIREGLGGLWGRVCGALKRAQLLHASLLPAAVLLLEDSSLLQRLLNAWTVACGTLLSADKKKTDKSFVYQITKKHRFMVAASEAGVLGTATLPPQLCQIMKEAESKFAKVACLLFDKNTAFLVRLALMLLYPALVLDFLFYGVWPPPPQAGSRVRGWGPESSGFHLEVAASLGEIPFEQEANAGPFLVDLLIKSDDALQAAMTPRGHAQSFLSLSSDDTRSSAAADECIDHERNTNHSPGIPKLHPQKLVYPQPWEPRRRRAREIPFSLD
ncbi:hypothetical protein Esti_005483 [Eimeria stiedai]